MISPTKLLQVSGSVPRRFQQSKLSANRMVAVGAFAVILSACSSSEESLKYVVTTEADDRIHPTDQQFRLRAYVSEYETPVNRQALVNALNQGYTITEDVCDNEAFPEIPLTTTPTDISVGDAVIFSNAGSTFATAPLQFEDETPSYVYGFVQSSEHSPNGLTADFPNDLLSDIPTQSVVDITPMRMTSPAAGVAPTVQTEFTWEAGNGRFLHIWFNNGENSAECYIVDDGSFTFPESVVAEFDNPQTPGQFDIERTAMSMSISGNKLLLSIRESSFADYESFSTLP